MVSLYVLNPVHKLRFLSNMMLKGSKRILKDISTSSTTSLTPSRDEEVEQTKRSKINVLNLIKTDLDDHISPEGLTRDPKYYKDDSENGFCVFRVENTLFKIHKCYLLREPSAFGDMLSLPFVEGTTNTTPIVLFDTAEQFRDLVWALYAPPIHFASAPDGNLLPIGRLLNVAELANKYCIVSYESWALQCILSLAQNPMGFLRSAPPEICARALNIAALTNHHELLNMVMQRLIARILWTDVERGPILEVAESRGLRRLQGVAYYKELVTLEQLSGYDDDNSDATLEILPPSISIEKRIRFLAARHSLVNLWDCVRMNPPTFLDNGCTSHMDCLASWTDMWLNVGNASQTMGHGPADVLGRLKTMMILLKKSMREPTSPITLDCTLAALESITTLRDDIVSGLMDHFREC